jgi:hypothetical protein
MNMPKPLQYINMFSPPEHIIYKIAQNSKLPLESGYHHKCSRMSDSDFQAMATNLYNLVRL